MHFRLHERTVKYLFSRRRHTHPVPFRKRMMYTTGSQLVSQVACQAARRPIEDYRVAWLGEQPYSLQVVPKGPFYPLRVFGFPQRDHRH